MRKKLLSLLLALALVLSLCPASLAAEDGGDVRETGFFTAQEHADLNYEDMEYVHLEAGPILAEMDAVRELLGDAANAAEVEERFNALADEFMNLLTMYTLINIRTYQDVYDDEATEEYEYTDALYYDVVDALIVLMKDVLESPCAGFLAAQLTEEDIEYYLGYEEMTQEEKDRAALETSLESEYYALAASIFVEYGGEEWTDDDAYYAYMDGEITYDEYEEISTQFAMKENEVLGELYLRMVDARQETARAAGYGNYAEYAYAEIYGRDFTTGEVRAFHQAVKDCGYHELALDLGDLFSDGVDVDVYYGDYAGDAALDMIEPYIARMSSELLEAFTYMRGHGLYDSGLSDSKADAGFTTLINGYNAPFFFNSPYGMLYDFTTAVHEFGHYNNYFWQPNGWNDSSKGIDLAEVHSQGLELLFSHWYPEIFGESAQSVLDYQMSNLVSSIYTGSLHDELQLFVYETEDVTLEQINQKYRQLAGEYGLVAEDDPRAEMYGWVGIPHTFTSPCYYISYAVSAAGAFTFWLDAQEDGYFDALDEYLGFTALPAGLSFQESFEAMGMESPLSAGFITDLAAALRTALAVDERLESMGQPAGFSDVAEDNWFYEYVMFMVASGLAEGYEDGTFRPNDPITWYALTGEESGDGGGAVTRGEFCEVVAAGMLGLDAADQSAAVEAMVGLGVIGGYPDGSLRPEAVMTRAEFCAAVCRAAIILESQAGDGAA